MVREPTHPYGCSDDGVDLPPIRWMLGLTPAERLQPAQDMADTVEKLRAGRGR